MLAVLTSFSTLIHTISRHCCSFRHLCIHTQIVYFCSITISNMSVAEYIAFPLGKEDVRMHFYPALVAVNKMKLLRNSPDLQWPLCLREACLLFYLYIHLVFESSFSRSLLNIACSTPHSDERAHSISGGRTLLSSAPEEMRQGVALGHVCVCHRNCIPKLGKELKMFLTREGALFSCCCSFCSLNGKV